MLTKNIDFKRNFFAVRLTNNLSLKVYGQLMDGENWSAIQITTAAGVCAIVDLCTTGKVRRQGFVRQEQFSFNDFITNRFGKYYKSTITSRLVSNEDRDDA